MLELLDAGVSGDEGQGEWCAQLPTRVRTLFSHWLSRCFAFVCVVYVPASYVLHRRQPACLHKTQIDLHKHTHIAHTNAHSHRSLNLIILRPLSQNNLQQPSLSNRAAHYLIRVVPAEPSEQDLSPSAASPQQQGASHTPATGVSPKRTAAAKGVTIAEKESSLETLLVWRVPLQLRSLHWAKVWQQQQAQTLPHAPLTTLPTSLAQQQHSMDQLVLSPPDSRAFSILSKFEDPQFIHTYTTYTSSQHTASTTHSPIPADFSADPQSPSQPSASPDALSSSSPSITYKLPRYGLSFRAVQSNQQPPVMQIMSQEFSGYALANCQQLVTTCSTTHRAIGYTLPGLCKRIHNLIKQSCRHGLPACVWRQLPSKRCTALLLAPF